MTVDEASRILQSLVGRSCTIERREADWNFYFGDRVNVSVAVPWRIVSALGILHGSDDGEQLFGLAQPVDGAAKANSILRDHRVLAVDLDGRTADLCIRFKDDLRVDFFNNSAGYEGWQAILPDHGGETTIIALGGGQLTASSG